MREQRLAKASVRSMAAALQRSIGLHELPLLRSVASLAPKRQRWANVKKRDDRMYRFLTAEAAATTTPVALRRPKSPEGARRASTQAWRFIFASFKARALCVTSNRWSPAAVPARPPLPSELPYHVYGHTASSQEASEKHRTWLREYHDYDTHADWPPITYELKLNTRRLSGFFSCGAFTKLLILNDFADTFGAGFVQFPRHFGPGVHIARLSFNAPTCAMLAAQPNNNGRFKDHFGQRWKAHHVGHLLCELRQACFRRYTEAAGQRLLADMARFYASPPGRDRFRGLAPALNLLSTYARCDMRAPICVLRYACSEMRAVICVL